MSCLSVFNSAKAHHGWAQRADEEHQAPLPGGAALLLPDYWQAVLCSRLCQRWRGEFLSHIALEKQKRGILSESFMLIVSVSSAALLPSPEGEDLPGAQSQVLCCRNCKRTGLPPLPAHCLQVMSSPAVPPRGFLPSWQVLQTHAQELRGR